MLTTNLNDNQFLILALIVFIILFIVGKCHLRCNDFKIEGFKGGCGYSGGYGYSNMGPGYSIVVAPTESFEHKNIKQCVGDCVQYHKGREAKKCVCDCFSKARGCVDECTQTHQGLECVNKCL